MCQLHLDTQVEITYTPAPNKALLIICRVFVREGGGYYREKGFKLREYFFYLLTNMPLYQRAVSLTMLTV
jgi:hypothetical protein